MNYFHQYVFFLLDEPPSFKFYQSSALSSIISQRVVRVSYSKQRTIRKGWRIFKVKDEVDELNSSDYSLIFVLLGKEGCMEVHCLFFAQSKRT
uniref:DUF667 domain-containing protein n=1 Tax=Heterorhabditis bacteriophora TaxID=37862 RepID=A0A1I7WJ01_HETBA